MTPYTHIEGCTCDLRLIDWARQLVIHLDPLCRLESTPLSEAEQTVVAAR